MIRINTIVGILLEDLSKDFNEDQLNIIKNKLFIVLNDYNIEKKTTAIAVIENEDLNKIAMFFVSKKVEGCSDKTIEYYKIVLKKFFDVLQLQLKEIKADNIRYYLAVRGMQNKLSKTSQDNELRVIKSFFKWLAGEGYISTIPTLNIKPIKQEKRIKKPFTETEMELLRQNADNKRDLAIIDTLYSTGVRVEELEGMNISDISDDEIIVFGKGEKERYVFLNAKARLSIKQYIDERKDDNDALFVSLKSPFNRLSKSGIEVMIRKLGNKSKIRKCHPHRFRRTTATNALNRGMPIEQVQQMLGHEKIETTTLYARSDINNVKASHRKHVI